MKLNQSNKIFLIFTICNSSYLREADLLFSSIKAYFKLDFEFVAVNIDPEFQVVHSEYQILPAQKIVKDHNLYDGLISKYNLTEFATSIKPKCFKYFFDKKFADVIYLDPDIKLFNSFNYLDKNGHQNYDLILTPHRCKPCSIDSYLSDIDILQTGAFNFGFLHLRNNSSVILLVEWWFELCKIYCFSDINSGFFTDQYFGNLFTTYFNLKVKLLDPKIYNVAYWNIDEIINFDINKISFIHFSKVNRPKNNLVFDYLSDFPDFKAICKSYSNQIPLVGTQINIGAEFIANSSFKRLLFSHISKKEISEFSLLRRLLIYFKIYSFKWLLTKLSFRKQAILFRL